MILAQHLFPLVLGITGLVFILCGWWIWQWPPKNINGGFGYRTPRSMKSQAAWDFSQVYAGRLLFYCGLALLVLALLCLPVIVTGGALVLLPSFIVLAFTALPLYLTERKLKAKFDHQH
jgi:uncharacterized membrane protein